MKEFYLTIWVFLETTRRDVAVSAKRKTLVHILMRSCYDIHYVVSRCLKVSPTYKSPALSRRFQNTYMVWGFPSYRRVMTLESQQLPASCGPARSFRAFIAAGMRERAMEAHIRQARALHAEFREHQPLNPPQVILINFNT